LQREGGHKNVKEKLLEKRQRTSYDIGSENWARKRRKMSKILYRRESTYPKMGRGILQGGFGGGGVNIMEQEDFYVDEGEKR